MEKGNTRSSSSSKTNNSESKNKQDVTNKHLRLPRFKESISPRPEARRKPNPQRNRELFDKRPRNRTGAFCERYRNEIAEDALSEPHVKHGCKKININHLLNFTLAPSENREVNGRRGTYHKYKHPKYNKELFLQANCQFVARDNGNYSVHQKNPDILVEWHLIEEIRLPSHEVPLCPICLYSPVAAKITRCGHIYCWPCILHYLALTDRTWQKCPICFEAVHKTELKSVTLKVQKAFCVGDEITMCLMKREKGSLVPTPVSHENPTSLLCNVDDDDTITRFRKLLMAKTSDIQAILKRELCELKEAYEKEKHTPEACFIESALKLLEEREKKLNEEISLMEPVVVKSDTNVEILEASEMETSRKHLESMSSTDSQDEIFVTELCGSPPNTSISTCASVSDNGNDLDKRSCSFFYQAEDGQHIYLHNINCRMLINEYGSLENAPQFLIAKIVEIEGVSMTEVLRKRLRYLQHLPLTCEFQVVELNFFNVLSKATMLLFEGEINKRRYYRNKKARDERRRERYIEQEENKKLGKYPKANYNLGSADQFPAYHPSDFQSLTQASDENNFEKSVSSSECIASSTEMSYALSTKPCVAETDTPITSFAQMLKDGPKIFTQTCSKSLTPTVKEIKTPTAIPNVDSDGDEAVPPPEYRQSFSDAIQAALDSVTLEEHSGNVPKSSKKKRNKKQLLFTTSMCRNK